MNDDLIARFKRYANAKCVFSDDFRDAVYALEAKDARIASLEAALKPFADVASRAFKGSHCAVVDYIDEYIVVKRGDLRTARGALGEKE